MINNLIVFLKELVVDFFSQDVPVVEYFAVFYSWCGTSKNNMISHLYILLKYS